MLAGLFSPEPALVAILGLTGMTVIVFQMLVGYRKIKFKGKRHWQVHKAIGWVIVAVTLVHGITALAYLMWWPF